VLKPKLHVIVSAPFAENTYLAHLEGSHDCLVVDPGLEPEQIRECLARERLTPRAILNTHGHADHIAGNEALKRCFPDCPLVIGAGDAPKLSDPELNLSAPFGMGLSSPPADVLVHEGDVYSAAGFDLLVHETPGHSAGHVIFLWKGGAPWLVFGGDVLFQGSVGRSDFPDGDAQQLAASIRDKLYTLPDDTIVLPGHGEPTTIGHEKRTNPFVRGE
jgi:glyoxylase-like metal-dependent hydrolase (beta-lactamase superfamily II)